MDWILSGTIYHVWAARSLRRHRDELAFRDRLRSGPEVAAEYAALKQDLAERFADDREAYTDAKSDFVRRLLEQVR